jgi:hypothetical protein
MWENGAIDVVSDLLISSFKESLLQESTIDATWDWKEYGISPTTAAAEAIERILIYKPQSYINNERLGCINGESCSFKFYISTLCSHIILTQICGN